MTRLEFGSARGLPEQLPRSPSQSRAAHGWGLARSGMATQAIAEALHTSPRYRRGTSLASSAKLRTAFGDRAGAPCRSRGSSKRLDPAALAAACGRCQRRRNLGRGRHALRLLNSHQAHELRSPSRSSGGFPTETRRPSLGLYLARQVVEAYGGSFEVLSRPANELLSR